MSQALYTDQRTGSEIREADDGAYQVVSGDGTEVALVEPETAEEIASIMQDMLDGTLEDGRPGPTGDGWVLGQMGHPILGRTGFAFFDPDASAEEQRDTAAEFHGGNDVVEVFAEVFSQ